MKILIFVLIYIIIGCLIDIWVQKGFKMDTIIMTIIWPIFLLICLIIMSVEKAEKKENKTTKLVEFELRDDQLRAGICQLHCCDCSIGSEGNRMKCFCEMRAKNGECPTTCATYDMIREEYCRE